MKKITVYIQQNYWLISILLLGSFLRIYEIDFQSLWMDEIYTMNVTNPDFTFKQFHDEIVLREGFPYFYFLLLKAFFAIFGYTGVVARMLSALAGIASIYVIYHLGKEIFNKRVGIIASFLLAINEFHIYYSQEARPYSLYILFFIITLFTLSKFIRKPKLKTAVWYGVTVGLLLNINFFSLINIFSQIIILLIFILFLPFDKRFKTFKLCLLSGVIAMVMFLPNYEILLKLLNFKSFWIPAPTDDSLAILFSEILGNFEITRFIFLIIFIYYFMKLFTLAIEKQILKDILNSGMQYSFVILFFSFIIFVAFILIKSYTSTSLILSRYFVTIAPLFILVLAISISLVKNRLARIALISAVLFFSLFNLFVKKKYYTTYQKSQYREVTSFIKRNNEEQLPVYTSLKYWYDYYFRNANEKTIGMPLEQLVSEMMQDTTKIKSFWYADAHIRPYQLSEKAEKFLEEKFFIDERIEAFDAWTRRYVLKEGYLEKYDFKKISKNNDKFNYNIEALEKREDNYIVSGWVFFDKQDSEYTKIKVLLARENEIVKIFHPTYILRTDVAPYFNLPYNLNNSGFSSTIATNGLSPGKYNIALYLEDSKTDKKGIIITDEVLIKE